MISIQNLKRIPRLSLRLTPFRFYTQPPIVPPKPIPEKTPTVAKVLGVAGLIPFIATTTTCVYMPETMYLMAEVQASYGSLILSFLGGIHWGLAMQHGGNIRYVASVIPCLIGFFAIDFVPHPPIRLIIEGITFAGLFIYDFATHRKSITPPWFLGLRVLLTGIVCSSMATTCYLIYKN